MCVRLVLCGNVDRVCVTWDEVRTYTRTGVIMLHFHAQKSHRNVEMMYFMMSVLVQSCLSDRIVCFLCNRYMYIQM